MKKVIVLGSTGSLGIPTLKLLRKHKKDFKLIGISANTSGKKLKEQAKKYNIPNTALHSKKQFLNLNDADIIINLLSGTAGIKPSRDALKKGKILLLANKESVIAAKLNHPNIIPIDSEHNAIYEILRRNPEQKIRKIYLPCSGGPFYEHKSLKNITPEQALRHPKWQMGQKISIESATLINKGMEIIEAHYLFNLPLSKIKTFHHPQCKIHGIVEFTNAAYAYHGKPKMEEHIENALLRAIGKTPKITVKKISTKNLKPLTTKKLKGIEIVLKAFKNNNMLKFLEKEEKAIAHFLKGEIEFGDIFSQL